MNQNRQIKILFIGNQLRKFLFCFDQYEANGISLSYHEQDIFFHYRMTLRCSKKAKEHLKEQHYSHLLFWFVQNPKFPCTKKDFFKFTFSISNSYKLFIKFYQDPQVSSTCLINYGFLIIY